MIPIIDMAKLFSSRGGIKSTIITTPLNAPVFTKAIERTKHLDISIQIIQFPAATSSGLPQGCENGDQIPREMVPTFFKATIMLREQLEQLLQEYRPNCLIADMFFLWATDVAAKFNIPRLVFHGTCFFYFSAAEQLRLNNSFKKLTEKSDSFVIPNLPHEIRLTRNQVRPSERNGIQTDFSKMLIRATESELRSYGVIANSFYELEPDYADHYRNVLNRKAWHIGPVSLSNRGFEDKAQRGKESAIDEFECLKWLDSKKPNSVIYICFGSTCNFPNIQLFEIATGLEASGQEFIWVVRKGKHEENEGKEKWLPEGFEERIKGKGLVIRGWAPQMVILDHQAIGGFVTHCGWNSILEGVSAGVPMVTWPTFADQLCNEKLVTEVLGIGIAVGDVEWDELGTNSVKWDTIEVAVKRIMAGEEAKERRNRVKALKQMASKAVEEGGSSYSDLSNLIKELISYHS